jgi:hypothetical protein
MGAAKYILFLSLPSFKPFVKTPLTTVYPEEKSFIELAIELDILWSRFLIENVENKKDQIKKAMPIFLDRKILGVTQLIWDPREGILYDDVGYEILQGFDQPQMRSVNDFVNEKIPGDSRVVIMPDAGC